MSESIPARKGADLFERSFSDDYEVRQSVQRGDFEVLTEETGQRRFWFKCPGPCGAVAPLLLRPVVSPKAGDHSWEFDGNMDAPTLKPSINHVGCWHGFLTAGVFVSC